jgi:hypothetical protein
MFEVGGGRKETTREAQYFGPDLTWKLPHVFPSPGVTQLSSRLLVTRFGDDAAAYEVVPCSE